MTASPLRNFSTAQLEEAVAKAFSDLAGGDFVVEISNIKFSSSKVNVLTGKAELVDLNVSVKRKPDPLSVDIDFVAPDGSVSSSMRVDAKN